MVRRKRQPETLWRLVDARCVQLADAVSGARTAVFVALTWSLVWAWALYTVDLGYLPTIFLKNARAMHALSSMDRGGAHFAEWCKNVPFEAGIAKTVSPLSPEKRLEVCAEATKLKFEWAEKAYLDSTLISFPGSFGKLSVSDLGLAGGFGLLLIISWCFFSSRRENHAIRAIVDMDDSSKRKNGRWCPTNFILKPQDPYLSAEHYAYAYHAVAQRFVFLFSRYDRPLLLITILLCCVPALVATWNIYTDGRDVIRLEVTSLYPRVFIECALLILIYFATAKIVLFQINTSALLNGWHLAARDVWMKEWDERTTDSASMVHVDVRAQRARKARR
jgi:hypothetical protein